MTRSTLVPTVVFVVLLLQQSTVAFKSRPTLYIRLSPQQQFSTSALSASASLSNAAFPTNNFLLEQLMAASMKKKLIFLAHPVAMIVLIFLMKQMFILLPTVLPKLTLFLLSLKSAFGNNKGKVEKKIGVDNNGNRFYGIAQPMIKENINGIPQRTVKKRVTVATQSTSSIEMARARVVSILAALDDESNNASRAKADDIAVKSQSVGSWSTLMRRDVEKEGKDAYLAKVKLMETDRTEKIIKQKQLEAEAILKQQQQMEELERKRREAVAAVVTTETNVVVLSTPSIRTETTRSTLLNWTPHMMILKS